MKKNHLVLNEQIERLRELIRKCYGAVAGKNGLVPEVGERNMENLPAAIGSIKGTITDLVVTENNKEYIANDYGVDGFGKVKTEIPNTLFEGINLISGKFKDNLSLLQLMAANPLVATYGEPTTWWGENLLLDIDDDKVEILHSYVAPNTFLNSYFVRNVNMRKLRIIRGSSLSYVFYNKYNGVGVCNLPELETIDGSTNIFNGNWTEINIPKLKTCNSNYVFNSLRLFNTVNAPSLESISGIFINDMPQIEYVYLPSLLSITNSISALLGNTNKSKLRYIEVSELQTSINLQRWTAEDVISEEDGANELNNNIITGIANKVADRSGLSPLTIAFSTQIKDILREDVVAIFTQKNWTLA